MFGHRKEYSETDSGTILIHNDSIASVALIAATDIEGVKSIGTKLTSRLLELIGRKSSVIKVTIDKNSRLSLTIPLITQYGYNIPDVANKVQENVRAAVEKMTDLSIKDININVQGVQR
jgi:uncharacterized alkaline shock family protein YloU